MNKYIFILQNNAIKLHPNLRQAISIDALLLKLLVSHISAMFITRRNLQTNSCGYTKMQNVPFSEVQIIMECVGSDNFALQRGINDHPYIYNDKLDQQDCRQLSLSCQECNIFHTLVSNVESMSDFYIPVYSRGNKSVL